MTIEQSKSQEALQPASTNHQHEQGILQFNEQHFRALIEHGSDVILLSDQDGNYSYASPSIQRVLGYSPEEVIQLNSLTLIHPDDIPSLTEACQRLLATPGLSEAQQFRVLHKNGLWRWVEATATNLLQEPQIQAIVTNFHDITDRKQIEERHHLLSQIINLFISSLDHQITLQEVADLMVPTLADYCRIALIDTKHQIKTIVASHIDPQKITLVKDLYEQYKGRISATHGVQTLLETGQPELISVVTEETLTPLGQENPTAIPIIHTLGLQSYMGVPLIVRGRTIGAITFSSVQPHRHYTRDDLNFAIEIARRLALVLDNAHLYQEAQEELVERKETEELLKHREEEHYRLAAIVESSNDAIVGKTLEGIITSWNHAAEQLFGYSAEEAIGQPIIMIIPPELRSEEDTIIRNLRQGIRIQHFETVRVRKNGTRVNVSLSISPVKNANGEVIGAAKIARDITRQKEIEQRKDDFISMASHELKTPVTSIKGFTQLLVRRFQRLGDEESLHFLARMDTQLNKLTKLISDLLDLSKIQAGRLEYREEPFELNALVKEIIENVQGTTSTHALILDASTQEQHVDVFGDRDRVGQVFINLLTNAIKYSPKANKVLIQVTKAGDNAVVRVQDFGIGIAVDYQEQIFERFYQINEPDLKTYPGLGIGLHISKEIVKRHHGRIRVDSQKGAGTTFSVFLPLFHEEE
jgi:PAS domain S-box-containing protein